MSTDLTKTEEGAVVLREDAFEEEDFGGGFEGTTGDDYALPFINVLQSLSPRVLDEEDEAKAGQIICTATDEIMDELEVIPCFVTHNFTEWVPRDQGGGGFVGVHDPESPIVVGAIQEAGGKFGKRLKNGNNDLMETYNLFAMVKGEDGDWLQCIIPFQSTKITPFRQFLTRCRKVKISVKTEDGVVRKNAPMYMHRWTFYTEKEKRDSGQSYNWRMKWADETPEASRLDPNGELFMQARAFKDLAKQGSLKTDYNKLNEKEAEDNIPF